MDVQEALDLLAGDLASLPSVEGAFLSGSLANRFQDAFSDIDLGVATKNTAQALSEAFAGRHHLLASVGEPAHSLERGWAHCRMIASLYSAAQFAPIGLEIDIIFSQLRHVPEQMPYAEYRILFDRRGKLGPILAAMDQRRPREETGGRIAEQLKWLPFYVHDARKACRRGDGFQVQSLFGEIRELIFFAAAVRQGAQVFGAKRAYRYLSAAERQTIEESYRSSDEKMIARLVQLYLECLTELRSEYRIADVVESAKIALQKLL